MQPKSTDPFQEIAEANSTLNLVMHATYMLRRFRSLGILAEYVEQDGQFSHFVVPANDYSFLRIEQDVAAEGESSTLIPLMEWIEYPEPARGLFEQMGKPDGYYQYRAKVTLLIDDYDPDFPDRETFASEDGPQEVISFSYNSKDFQQFLFGAIFHINNETNFEVYPEFRKSRVAL